MADKGKDKLQGDTSSRKVQYVFERPDSMGAVEGEEGSVPQHLASKADQGALLRQGRGARGRGPVPRGSSVCCAIPARSLPARSPL